MGNNTSEKLVREMQRELRSLKSQNFIDPAFTPQPLLKGHISAPSTRGDKTKKGKQFLVTFTPNKPGNVLAMCFVNPVQQPNYYNDLGFFYATQFAPVQIEPGKFIIRTMYGVGEGNNYELDVYVSSTVAGSIRIDDQGEFTE